MAARVTACFQELNLIRLATVLSLILAIGACSQEAPGPTGEVKTDDGSCLSLDAGPDLLEYKNDIEPCATPASLAINGEQVAVNVDVFVSFLSDEVFQRMNADSKYCVEDCDFQIVAKQYLPRLAGYLDQLKGTYQKCRPSTRFADGSSTSSSDDPSLTPKGKSFLTLHLLELLAGHGISIRTESGKVDYQAIKAALE